MPRTTVQKRFYAKTLRREMTRAEEAIWTLLRANRFKGLRFKRQVPVGVYVVDFACLSRKLVIELDGPPHDDEAQRAHDRRRDATLRAMGYSILRFSNDVALAAPEKLFAEIEAHLDAA